MSTIFLCENKQTMDIVGLIKGHAGSDLMNKFGFSNDKVDGIAKTIANVADEKSVASGLGSALGSFLSNKSGDPMSKIGENLVNSLMKEHNLDNAIALKVKDMVLPIIIEAVKGQVGNKMDGLLGKFKF